jgi:hypothetical protein
LIPLNYRRKKYANNTPIPQPIGGLPQNPYTKRYQNQYPTDYISPIPSSRSPQLPSFAFALPSGSVFFPQTNFSHLFLSPPQLLSGKVPPQQSTFTSFRIVSNWNTFIHFRDTNPHFYSLPPTNSSVAKFPSTSSLYLFPHPHTSFTGSFLTTSFGVLYCLPPVSLPSINLSL